MSDSTSNKSPWPFLVGSILMFAAVVVIAAVVWRFLQAPAALQPTPQPVPVVQPNGPTPQSAQTQPGLTTAPPANPPALDTKKARAAIEELRPLLTFAADAREAFVTKDENAHRLTLAEFEKRWKDLCAIRPPATPESANGFHTRLDEIELSGTDKNASIRLGHLERQIAETKSTLERFNANVTKELAALQTGMDQHREKVPAENIQQLEEQRRTEAALRAAEEERIRKEKAILEVKPFLGTYYIKESDWSFTVTTERVGRTVRDTINISNNTVSAKAGDVVVRLKDKRGERLFTAEMLFARGNWSPVTLELLPSGNLKISLTGGSSESWEATREKEPEKSP